MGVTVSDFALLANDETGGIGAGAGACAGEGCRFALGIVTVPGCA